MDCERLIERAREDGFVLGLRLASNACRVARLDDMANALTDIALDPAPFAHLTHQQVAMAFTAAITRAIVARNNGKVVSIVPTEEISDAL